MQEGALLASQPPPWGAGVRMAPSANLVGASARVWRDPIDDAALAALIPAAAALGFDVLELPLARPGAWNPRRAAGLLAEHGLRATVCAQMTPGRDIGSFDPVAVREGVAYLRSCINAAAVLDGLVCGPLHGPALPPRQIGRTEREVVVERVAISLAGLAAHAAERGVRLALEPVNRYESSVLNTAAQAFELVDYIDSPACGIALDSFHMNIEERCPAAAIRAAGTRLMHLHVSANDRGAPGSDHVYWGAIAEALREARYRGALVLEADGLGEAGAREALGFLRSLLLQTPAYA